MVQRISGSVRRFVVVLAMVVLSALVLAVPAMAARGFVSAVLTGAEEAPPVVTDGSGTSEFKINTTKKRICYEIDVSNLSSPPLGYGGGAHIHKGPPGEDGPIVITLKPPSGTDGQSSGCLRAKRDLLTKILESPSKFYVNIHTEDHEGGEVRGQLQAGKLPAAG
jgi:hypothetical protein